jgi:hypothetical protein
MEVIAPPELCTIPARGSAVAAESDAVVLVFAPPDTCAVPDGVSCTVDEAVVDDESDGVVDPESEDEEDPLVCEPVPANATPGVPAMPNPTPSATARAPTRPIYPA